ncbi:UNVERIFIED_CONTAM: hypothetical protein K2H54_044323 [Gekko kuhli]
MTLKLRAGLLALPPGGSDGDVTIAVAVGPGPVPAQAAGAAGQSCASHLTTSWASGKAMAAAGPSSRSG